MGIEGNIQTQIINSLFYIMWGNYAINETGRGGCLLSDLAVIIWECCIGANIA